MRIEQARHMWIFDDVKIAWDAETDTTKTGMLNGEPFLSLQVACKEGNQAASRVFIKEEDTEESEIKMLQEFGQFLLGLNGSYTRLGYYATTYDQPVLVYRLEKLKPKLLEAGKLPRWYWKICDFLNAAPIAVDSIARTYMMQYTNSQYPTTWKLSALFTHYAFSQLPLIAGKELVSDDPNTKGKEIKQLWEKDRKAFQQYCEADVVNLLLISEQMLNGQKR